MGLVIPIGSETTFAFIRWREKLPFIQPCLYLMENISEDRGSVDLMLLEEERCVDRYIDDFLNPTCSMPVNSVQKFDRMGLIVGRQYD
jgi:hypothetical protein